MASPFVPHELKECLINYQLKDLIPMINDYALSNYIQLCIHDIISYYLSWKVFNIEMITKRIYKNYIKCYGLHFADFLNKQGPALKNTYAKKYLPDFHLLKVENEQPISELIGLNKILGHNTTHIIKPPFYDISFSMCDILIDVGDKEGFYDQEKGDSVEKFLTYWIIK